MERSGTLDHLESLTDTAKTINEALHDLRGTFGHLQDRLAPYFTTAKAKDVARQGRDYAKRHPAAVTLAVAGAGLLIGWWLSQRGADHDEG